MGAPAPRVWGRLPRAVDVQSCGFIPPSLRLCGRPAPRLLLPNSVVPQRPPCTSSGRDRRGCGRHELQSLVLGPGSAPGRAVILPLCGRPGGGRRHGQDGLAALYLPGTPSRCLLRPMRVAWPEHGLRSPVPQGNLESILQTPGGSPPRLSEGALVAFSLYCRLSIHLQYKVCLSLGQGAGLSGPGLCTDLSALVFGQFCSEGKVYLSTLEDTGSWL